MKTLFGNLLGLFLLIGSVSAQEFKTVKIGNQIWMASNLSVKVPGSWAYEENPAMEAKYGRLYTREAAIKFCPKGWHLPTQKEWDNLLLELGGEDKAGKSLKIVGGSSFNAKLGGIAGVGNYRLLDSYGAYWTATAVDKDNAWFVYLTSESSIATLTYSTKSQGFSVRYVKNSN